MTTNQRPTLFHHLWKSMLGMGVVSLLLGIVILVWPGISISVAGALFGAYLLLSGIAQVIFAFSLDVSGGERLLLFVSGGLSLVLGVLAFRHLGQGYAILLLAIWVGVGFMFQGVAETALAISYPALPGRGWHIFLGITSVIAGLVVLAWPFDSIVVLAVVAGAWLVALGVFQIAWSLQARKGVSDLEKGVGRRAPLATA
ncbi:HdeD family acid-resistance protein [Mycobacterium sp. MMS18-G62]